MLLNDFNIIKYNVIKKNETNGKLFEKYEAKIFRQLKWYTYINTQRSEANLIKKINSEKSRQRFEEPEDSEFKYAFINTVQKFELPEKFIINHNDLSEFSRYFFPYVALVIDPRKRISKIGKDEDSSKFGTYLKYKRVSNVFINASNGTNTTTGSTLTTFLKLRFIFAP